MKKLLAAGAVAGFVLLGAGIAPASAAPPEGQLCRADGVETIELAEGINTLSLEAPEGYVIAEVCIKAGSVNSVKNPGGAQRFEPYTTTWGIVWEKDISHYYVRYAESPSECNPSGYYCDDDSSSGR